MRHCSAPPIRITAGRKLVCLAWTLLLAPCLAPVAPAALLGDLDGDGQATVADVVRYVNHLDGTTTLTTPEAGQADLNLNGTVDRSDLARIVDAVLGRGGLPLTALDAPAATLVIQALPRIRYPQDDPADFDFGGLVPHDLCHMAILLAEGATVGQLNSLLADRGANIEGALPSARVVMIRIPRAADVQATLDLRDELIALPAVQDAVPNKMTFNALEEAAGELVQEESSLLQSIEASLTPPSSNLTDWHWELEPAGLNWPLERSRVAQSWNLLEFGRRKIAAGQASVVAAIDAGFNNPTHADQVSPFFIDSASSGTRPSRVATHGTAVMGVMAAKFDNITGVQGINPLATRGIGLPHWWHPATVDDPYAASELRTMDDIFHLLRTHPDLRVINISLGALPDDTDAETEELPNVPLGITYANWMDFHGFFWNASFKNFIDNERGDFLVFCSAGNDSNYPNNSSIEERYNSIGCNIAVRYADSPFVSVGATNLGGTVASFSNVTETSGGNRASAGGEDFGVLDGPGDVYRPNNGTSFASPFVAGLASYLWALDPGLTPSQVKTLLLDPEYTRNIDAAGQFPAGPPEVDAFSAVMGIDLLHGNYAMQRALVDVDDGTADGNLRMRALASELDPDSIHTPDQRRGDGRVNMRDFRVFRDAWLEARGMTEFLDGPATHFKRDLNFDGWTAMGRAAPGHPVDVPRANRLPKVDFEEDFSRYDFNGNGTIDSDGHLVNPPEDALELFKTDPDNLEFQLSQTYLRDIDVMLNPNVWETDEENVGVLVTLPAGAERGDKPRTAQPKPRQLAPVWDGGNIRNTIGGDYINYFWSADLHMDCEQPDLVPGQTPGPFDPFVIRSNQMGFNEFLGGSDWSGVLTVPFVPDFAPDYDVDKDMVTLRYTRVEGDEFHRYSVEFDPKPGEDFRVVLGWDKFEFSSTTRGASTAIFRPAGCRELIQRNEGYLGTPYATRVVPNTVDFFAEADDLARQTLLSRSRMNGWLPQPIQVEAIFGVDGFDANNDRIYVVGAYFYYE